MSKMTKKRRVRIEVKDAKGKFLYYTDQIVKGDGAITIPAGALMLGRRKAKRDETATLH